MKRISAVQALGSGDYHDFAYDNMLSNKAYRVAISESSNAEKLLNSFKDRYKSYRLAWKGQPDHAISSKLLGDKFIDFAQSPMCVDIEVAAICDLACPFCYRQSIATPDKVMSLDLFHTIIDQCIDIGVPSVKLNWRGEPLLNPKLPEMIKYAKNKGILEVIINTNATTLDKKTSLAIIDAGLDLMIYSFDGGSKETYEKMRPGRFENNYFENVYENIRLFSELRDEKKAIFPRTKIQMILTDDTQKEKNDFIDLFNDCVDYVSVKAFTERGNNLSGLEEEIRNKVKSVLNTSSDSIPYWRDMEGSLYISSNRLPCEQPFQRLMVTYDGRVSMCCYDWGVENPVGYVDEAAYIDGEHEYERVIELVNDGKRGYSGFMDGVRLPNNYSNPEKKVGTIKNIWEGRDIQKVRDNHILNKIESIEVCKKCPFKETYNWKKL